MLDTARPGMPCRDVDRGQQTGLSRVREIDTIQVEQHACGVVGRGHVVAGRDQLLADEQIGSADACGQIERGNGGLLRASEVDHREPGQRDITARPRVEIELVAWIP